MASIYPAVIPTAWSAYTAANPPTIRPDASPSFRQKVLADHRRPHVTETNGRPFVFRFHLDLVGAEEVIRCCARGRDRAVWLGCSDYSVVQITPANVLGALAFVYQGTYPAIGGPIDLPPRAIIEPLIPAAVEFVRAAGLLDLDAEVEAVERTFAEAAQ